MKTLTGGVLGLFPSFARIGGVERSGQAAWRAITEASAGENHLISYGPLVETMPGSGFTTHQTSSQLGSVLLAANRKWPVRMTVVWHLGMLKLLPFIRGGGSTVLFLHGIEAWRPASSAVARLALAKLLGRVDLFLSNSDFTWEKFLECHRDMPDLRSAKQCTVALGIGEPRDAGRDVSPTDPPSAVMIGRVARSEGYKGHDAVIAAWSQVRAGIPGAMLRMIGNCDMREELLALAARHGVGDAVEIAGMVSEEAKERYLSKCRCMALPSRGEGFGLAYIESMRMGRPSVVSLSDAGREVVCAERNGAAAGLAVNPSDAGALAAALIRLMTPGAEWERWSADSRRRYAANFTESQFRERLMAALAGLA